MKPKRLPSHINLDEIFRYEDGKLYWKTNRRGGAKAGDRAGCSNSFGYRQIMIGGKWYKEHRLVWELLTGKAPEQQLDHLDGDRSNNRIENLREVDAFENMHNTKLYVTSTTGFRGVHNTNEGYKAQGFLKGKPIHLGRFDSLDEAVKARKNFESIEGNYTQRGATHALPQ